MKRNRMIIKKFVHRMKNMTSARTLHRWIDFVSERRAARNCIRRVMQHMNNRRLGMGFRSWISHLHKSKAAMIKRQHHRRISMRFIHVSRNRKLNAAFRAWHSSCIIMKRNRMIIKKFVHRMKNITSARTLHRWIDFVSERRAARNCIRRVMQHMNNRRLGIGFRSWISYLHKSKAAMMKRQHHRRISMRFIHVSRKTENRRISTIHTET